MAKAKVQAQPLSPAQQDQEDLSKAPSLPLTTEGQILPEPAPQIVDEVETAADGKTFYGKGDKSKQYPIPVANKGHVVVKQNRVGQDNGGMYDVPNTESIQTYEPQVYQKMLDTNFFSESKLKVQVLHEPK